MDRQRAITVWMFGLVIFGLMLPSFAFAEADPVVYHDKPASGTMIAAALETVGYFAQAEVLSQMSNWIETLGALVYLGVLFSMVLTVSLSGNYRAALWTLVGPAMFFFASGIEIKGYKNQVQAVGAEWRFGAFEDTEKVKEMVLADPNVGDAGHVSWLFHNYNLLISEVSQKLIKVATDENMKRQFLFMARQRTMEYLFAQEISDPQLNALETYFLSQCAVEMDYARLIALGNRDSTFARNPEYSNAVYQYCERFPRRDKPFSPGPHQKFAFAIGATGGKVTREEHQNTGKQTLGLVSCEDMWGWLLKGASNEGKKATEEASHTNIDPSGFKRYGTAIALENASDVLEKLSSSDAVMPRRISGGDPCKKGQGAKGSKEITKEDIKRWAKEGVVFDKLSQIIGGRMLSKGLKTHPSSLMLTRAMTNHSTLRPDDGAGREVRISPSAGAESIRSQKAHDFAVARRYDAFMLLMLLPYLQGLLLYGLSVIYPFFALMLLMPGYAGSFLGWMALWAWVKFWDVGWALVMVADEIIWQLLPKTAFYNPDQDANYSSPISILEGAFDGDPSYNLGTYWLLLSTMIVGVPVVSAQAMLGAKKAFMMPLLDGIKDIGTRISTSAGNWESSHLTYLADAAKQRTGLDSTMRESFSTFKGDYQVNQKLNTFNKDLMAEAVQAQKEGSSKVMSDIAADGAGLLSGGARFLNSAAQSAAANGLAPQALADWTQGLADSTQKVKEAAVSNQQAATDRFNAGLDARKASIGAHSLQYQYELADFLEELKGADSMAEIIDLIGGSAILGGSFDSPELEEQMMAALEKVVDEHLGKGEGKDQDAYLTPNFTLKEHQDLKEQWMEIYKTMVLNKVRAWHQQDRGVVMSAGAVPAYAFFGGFGKAPGLWGAWRTFDAASQASYSGLKLEQETNRRQGQLLALANDVYVYQAMFDPLWQSYEVMRNAMATNRGEYFFHPRPPANVRAALDNMQENFGINREELGAQVEGSNTRFFLDLLTPFATSGGDN